MAYRLHTDVCQTWYMDRQDISLCLGGDEEQTRG